MNDALIKAKVAEYTNFLLEHAKRKGYGDGYSYALGAVSTMLELSIGKPTEEVLRMIDTNIGFIGNS